MVIKHLDILNDIDITVEYSEKLTVGSWWKKENVCDVYSRLYYIKSGSGYLLHGDRRIALEPWHVYLIPLGCNFSFGCDELEKIFFHIYIPTIENYDLLSNVGDICVLPFSQDSYERLESAYLSDDYIGLLNVKSILLETVLSMLAEYELQNIPIKNYSLLVQRALRYINQNAKISLTAKGISNKLFVSENSLIKSFKAQVGVTLGRYIEKTVFIKSCHLLADKSKSIKDISCELDFCDRYYFSRWFKRVSEKTPSDYRRSMRA